MESVEDLRKLSFSDNCILELSDCLVCEYNVALVYTELERKEEHWDVDSLVLSHLHDLELAGVGLWD